MVQERGFFRKIEIFRGYPGEDQVPGSGRKKGGEACSKRPQSWYGGRWHGPSEDGDICLL